MNKCILEIKKVNMSFDHFDKLNKIYKLSVDNINSNNPNMLFKSANEMRELTKKVNHNNHPFILFKAKIIDGISSAASDGKFEFEISFPDNVFSRELKNSLIGELQLSGYTVSIITDVLDTMLVGLKISWNEL